eukprot:CAMPEP_0197540338 /NCGR_PEP_ID=MMETSP1318-20131121/65467_1 /TAXON_ID=552666 /ORGANISM="Partenskyella glossopodia, Strain RCC365" /LENGTH=413 /DNA_ID=CAMNT_0043099287 /DNA_START=59 /DNA_END=1297 /DNA_ORIENTATION=+
MPRSRSMVTGNMLDIRFRNLNFVFAVIGFSLISPTAVVVDASGGAAFAAPLSRGLRVASRGSSSVSSSSSSVSVSGRGTFNKRLRSAVSRLRSEVGRFGGKTQVAKLGGMDGRLPWRRGDGDGAHCSAAALLGKDFGAAAALLDGTDDRVLAAEDTVATDVAGADTAADFGGGVLIGVHDSGQSPQLPNNNPAENDPHQLAHSKFREKFVIRRAKMEEFGEVARLTADVFDRDMLDQTVKEMRPDFVRPITQLFADITYWIFLQDYQRNLQECLKSKHKTAPIARKQAQSMTSRYMRYALTKQNDVRMFNVLVAEEKATKKIVGTVTVFRFPAEATMPPPFPTTFPKRLYASTLAVSKDCRRQGIAKQLMNASEKLAARWGQEYLYLHVLKPNIDAQLLYFKCGYELVKEDPW